MSFHYRVWGRRLCILVHFGLCNLQQLLALLQLALYVLELLCLNFNESLQLCRAGLLGLERGRGPLRLCPCSGLPLRAGGTYGRRRQACKQTHTIG